MTRLSDLTAAIQDADRRGKYDELQTLRRLREQEVKKLESQNAAETRQNQRAASEPSEQELKILGSVASTIDKNSSSDEEANQIYQQALPNLQKTFSHISFPNQISKEYLQSIATSAGLPTGPTRVDEKNKQLEAIRAHNSAQEANQAQAREQGAAIDAGVYQGAAQDQSTPSEQIPTSDDIEILENQLDYLARLDTKEAKAKQVELGLKLAEMRNRAKRNPYTAKLMEQAAQERAQRPAGPAGDVLQPAPAATEAQQQIQEGLRKSDIDITSEEQKQLSGIDDTLAAVTNFESILNSSNVTGPGADLVDTVTRGKAAANRLTRTNIFELTPEQQKNLEVSDVLNSLTLDFVKTRLEATKGSVSDKEMSLFLNSVPNIRNTVSGNKTILRFMKAALVRSKTRAEFNRAYLEKNNTRSGLNEAWTKFKNENPILSVSLTTNDGTPISQEDIDETIRKNSDINSIYDIADKLDVRLESKVNEDALSNFQGYL